MTLTRPFSPSESNCLVYKPHRNFWAENLSKRCSLYTSVYGKFVSKNAIFGVKREVTILFPVSCDRTN